MVSSDLILGIFYSDENNLIHESIKDAQIMTPENRERVKMLPFKFLGPVFLTSGIDSENMWQIDFIESSLSLHQKQSDKAGMLQSFFNLNSAVKKEEGIVTNLFTLIGSPHTEDTKVIYEKMVDYIHPAIEQGLKVHEKDIGRKFRSARFINEELQRGLDLVEHYLGSSRKIYWEEQLSYYCVGIIERIIIGDKKNSYLYTFDKDNSLRRTYLSLIPSFYVMAILPDFYENLVIETLGLFDITSYYPNIRFIKLSNDYSKVTYFEDFDEEKGEKRSIGLILVQVNETTKESYNISYFRKNLRHILDNKGKTEEIISKINPHFSVRKWPSIEEPELDEIHKILDKKNY